MEGQSVMEAAAALGKAIRESKEYDAFVTTRAIAELDAKAYHLLLQYRKYEQKLLDLMTAPLPDPVELRRGMKELDEAKELIMENDVARDYIQSSAVILRIVAQVNETLGRFVDISPLISKSAEEYSGESDHAKH